MAAPSNPSPVPPRPADSAIVRSIRQASRSSESDFGLLMAEAAQESSFRPDTKAASGSAAGLYQFIGSTWLEMVHRFGAKYGLGALAQQITVTPSGQFRADNPAAKQQILALRNDPSLAAAMAGEYANLNKDEVERALGRPAGPADLYMAHFLGAGGATQFLKALATRGDTPAASLLPEAARANPVVFYAAETGRPKTVAEIYDALGGRIAAEAQSFDSNSLAALSASEPDSGAAPVASKGIARLATRADFGGVRLSPPVAAMLDTLTWAAMRLADGGAPAPHDRHRTQPETSS